MKDDSGTVDYRHDYECLREENSKLRATNQRLIWALHDAIDRPKGVVPDSASEFYNYRKTAK